MATREGYLMVDHRASPGLPEDVARAAGYDPKHCREGKMFEAASLTCAHCKVSIIKNPFRVRERANCIKCSHYICDFCEAESRLPDYVHTPFEKLVMDGLDRQAKTLFCDTPVPLRPTLILP